jgi:hypothetical protein
MALSEKEKERRRLVRERRAERQAARELRIREGARRQNERLSTRLENSRSAATAREENLRERQAEQRTAATLREQELRTNSQLRQQTQRDTYEVRSQRQKAKYEESLANQRDRYQASVARHEKKRREAANDSVLQMRQQRENLRAQGRAMVQMERDKQRAKVELAAEKKNNPLHARFGCALPTVGQDVIMRRLQYDKDQMTVVEREYGQFVSDIEKNEAASRLDASKELSENRGYLYNNLIRMGERSRAAILSPDLGRNMESWLAANLAVVQRQFGASKEYTAAGWARFSLQQAQKDSQGYLNRLLREHRLQEQIVDNSKKLDKIFRRYNIRRPADRGYISTKAVEYGAVPYLENVGGIGRVSRMEIDAKRRNFLEYLKDKGFSQTDIDEVMRLGADTSRVYNQTAIIAKQTGIDIADATTQGLGYIPRILSRDALKRINWRHQDLVEGTVEWLDGSSEGIGSILTKSRTTANTLVENEVLLDYVVRREALRRTDEAGEKGNPLSIYEKIAGFPGATLGDVLSDHRLSNTLLANELGDEIVTALVDTGVLGRIPMDGAEVYEYLAKKFNLPFEGIDELMVTDWQRGYQLYTRQLEGLAKESGYVNEIVSNVTTGKWGVSAEQLSQNPEQYKGWVPLVGTVDKPGVLNESQLSQFFLDKTTRMGLEQGRLMRNSFVHPVAAEVIQAVHKSSVDPISLGVIGDLIRNQGRLWRGMALATVEFIPRQFFSTTMFTFAGGGNLLSLPEIATRLTLYTAATFMGDRLRLTPNQLAEKFFDNTRRIYGADKLTMLEVWNMAKEQGFITDIDPQLGMSITGSADSSSVLNPKLIRRQLRYLRNALDEGGIRRFIAESGGILNDAVMTALIPIMYGNNMADTLGRFNGLLSTMRTYTPSDAFHNPLHSTVKDGVYATGHLISGVQKYHDTVEDAITHWKNYFYDYDDTTQIDNVLNNYNIVPFWSFMSKNMPAAFRHVANHPSRYAAFARIYAMMNSDAVQDQELNEASVPPWMLQAQPVMIKIKGGRADGSDAWMAMPLQSVDPYTGVFDDAKGVSTYALRALGLWGDHTRPGTTMDILDEAPGSGNNPNPIWDIILNRLNPLAKLAMSEFSNRDLTTEYKPPLDDSQVNSFLGYGMSPRTEMWLGSMFPILRTLNRENPGLLMGTPDYTNPYTGEVRRGTNSQMPFSDGAKRTDSQPADNLQEFPGLRLNQTLRFFGLKLYPVDEATQVGRTLMDINQSLIEQKEWLQRGYRRLNQLDEGTSSYNKLKEELDMGQQFFMQVAGDRLRLQNYAREKGMTPDRALRELTSRGIRVGDQSSGLTPQQEHDQIQRELTSP